MLATRQATFHDVMCVCTQSSTSVYLSKTSHDQRLALFVCVLVLTQSSALRNKNLAIWSILTILSLLNTVVTHSYRGPSVMLGSGGFVAWSCSTWNRERGYALGRYHKHYQNGRVCKNGLRHDVQLYWQKEYAHDFVWTASKHWV